MGRVIVKLGEKWGIDIGSKRFSRERIFGMVVRPC